MSNHLKGFIYLMLSTVFFGTMPLWTKIACAGGTDTGSVLFFRFFLPIVPLFIYLKAKKVPMKVTANEARKILLLGICGYGITAMLLFLSYNYIPSGMATVIHFCYPVFVLLGSVVFLKKRVSVAKVICVFLCVGGIFLFFDGGVEAKGITGFVLAFVSGITYAFYILYLDNSDLKDMSTLKLIFYMNIVASVLNLARTSVSGGMDITMTGTAWAAMTILALGTTFIGVSFFQKGTRLVGAQNAAILSTFEPVTSVIVGIIVLKETCNARSVVGCLLILASVMITAIQGEEK